MHVGKMLRRVEHRQIEAPGRQVQDHLVRIVDLDIDRQFGHRRPHPFQPALQHTLIELELDADADELIELADRLDLAAGIEPSELDGTRMVFEADAGDGRLGAALAADEQLLVEQRFQRTDAARNGRLGDAQPLRRAVEVAGLDQVQERVEQFDLHLGHPAQKLRNGYRFLARPDNG